MPDTERPERSHPQPAQMSAPATVRTTTIIITGTCLLSDPPVADLPAELCVNCGKSHAGNTTVIHATTEMMERLAKHLYLPDGDTVYQYNKRMYFRWWIDPECIHSDAEYGTIGRRSANPTKIKLNDTRYYRLYVEIGRQYDHLFAGGTWPQLNIEYTVKHKEGHLETVQTAAGVSPSDDDMKKWWPDNTKLVQTNDTYLGPLCEALQQEYIPIKPLLDMIIDYLPNRYMYIVPIEWAKSFDL